jgi:hypothetical protein
MIAIHQRDVILSNTDLAGDKVGRFSTDEAGTLVFSGPVAATKKEREYMHRADENSLALAMYAGWGKWKPSNKSPHSLTPCHKQQWIPPPCSDVKPWKSRKPPSAYRSGVRCPLHCSSCECLRPLLCHSESLLLILNVAFSRKLGVMNSFPGVFCPDQASAAGSTRLARV